MRPFDEVAASSKASQSRIELLMLLELVQYHLGRAPRSVLEIGVHKGYSMEAWRDAFDPEILVGVDLDASLVENSAFDIVEGDSRYVMPEVAYRFPQGVDFLFIDGGHLYDEVRDDFDLYFGLVNSPGIVAFHDIKREGPKWRGLVEVNLFWEEVCSLYDSEVVWAGGEDDPGLGVLRI